MVPTVCKWCKLKQVIFQLSFSVRLQWYRWQARLPKSPISTTAVVAAAATTTKNLTKATLTTVTLKTAAL
jgi:hypothetical protein